MWGRLRHPYPNRSNAMEGPVSFPSSSLQMQHLRAVTRVEVFPGSFLLLLCLFLFFPSPPLLVLKPSPLPVPLPPYFCSSPVFRIFHSFLVVLLFFYYVLYLFVFVPFVSDVYLIQEKSRALTCSRLGRDRRSVSPAPRSRCHT